MRPTSKARARAMIPNTFTQRGVLAVASCPGSLPESRVSE
jgi:hypothetical protein